MYEKVFALDSRPFTSAPFVKHYFAAQAIGQANFQAQQCIDRAVGPVIVIGGTGTGKSLLLAMLAEQYAEQFNVVNLACARLDQRSDLLQSILFELHQPYRDMAEGELRLALIDYLKPNDHSPNGVLLLVDEAQNLNADLLDEVRLITNFVREGQPRVRLVIAGSQRLEDTLNDTKLESFNQRIAARCYLTNLGYDETVAYVRTHVDRVGGSGQELFPEQTTRVIFEVSDGCPRLINQICDQALLLAAVNNLPFITEQCAQEAWRDAQNLPSAWPADNLAQSGDNNVSDEKCEVIEFGQLDEEPNDDECEEPHSTEIATEETHQEFAHDKELADPTGDTLDSGTSIDDETGSRNTTEFEQTPHPILDQQTASEDPHATPILGELETVDNPFDEQFEEEELLVDQHLPLFAEQNRSSLTLTPEELDSIRLPQKNISFEELQADLLGETADGANADSGLNEAMADFEPCDPELTFSETEGSDFIERRAEEILQTLIVEEQRPETANPNDDDQMSTSSTDEPIINECPVVPFEETAIRNKPGSDDRDMIIVSRVDHLHATEPNEDGSDDFMPSRPSTGRAERMDYQDLFDQLRKLSTDE